MGEWKGGESSACRRHLRGNPEESNRVQAYPYRHAGEQGLHNHRSIQNLSECGWWQPPKLYDVAS